MTMIQPRHVGVFMCIWLLCLAVLAQSTSPELEEFQPGVPMKSIPVHRLPRSYAGRKRTLTKFQPKNSIQLRFIEAEKYEYYGSCHHVDMLVELKTDDGNHTVQSLNPFAFQNAVKSFSCSGSPAQINIQLSPEYAQQARRWSMPSTRVFGIVIPHDHVDLKGNSACFSDLSASAKKYTQEHPMEIVVKMVKNPQFLDTKNPTTLSLTVVKTDIWSNMNRAQSVQIYHKPIEDMVSEVFKKRSTAEQDGPMWDFEHSLSAATENVNSQTTADDVNNVNTNLDQSTVKGYAQASMAWKQTCIKNIFTGKMNCLNWGITQSKISGMTQVNHQAKVSVKASSGNIEARSVNVENKNKTQPLLTLTKVNFTTPSFNLMAPIPLLGFTVPGVFDMGANVGLGGSVSLDVLVQATKDLLVNTGSSTSCPWVIEWDGSFFDLPTIQFGTCTLPGTPKFASDSNSILRRSDSESIMYFGPDPESVPEGKTVSLSARSTGSRETAFVSIGMTVSPSLGMGLKVFGFTALSAGISAPISLGINSNWDTDKTTTCPANHVELNSDGSASLKINGGFFGFSKSIPIVEGPTLTTPSTCVPHP
ncbi:hypothetical protein BGX20_010950 [Mortierella sp. AD010]|nr:hypothetical protein BGX20_010950 [Mortierella sp. AD010]